MSGKYDNREGANPIVFAEIEPGDSALSVLNAKDGSGDASIFADVFTGLRDGKAIGRGTGRQQDHEK